MQIWQLALIELRNIKASKALGCISRAWLLESYACSTVFYFPMSCTIRGKQNLPQKRRCQLFSFSVCLRGENSLAMLLVNAFKKCNMQLAFWLSLLSKHCTIPACKGCSCTANQNPCSLQYLFVNSLNPKSDKHLISPYNITPESYIKVMRITEMITNKRSL